MKFQLMFFALLLACNCTGIAGLQEATNNNNQNNMNNQQNNQNNYPTNNIPDGGHQDQQGDGMVGCDPKNFTLKESPPAEVYLVIDRSGSMLEPGATPGKTRWEEVVSAVDTALTQYENSVYFGVLLFPANGECGTSGPVVPIGPSTRDEIFFELSRAIPAGGTPTAAALRNAAVSLIQYHQPGSPQFIILATDGGPNCNFALPVSPTCSCTYSSSFEYCCTNYPGACFFGSGCLDDANTLAVIEENRTQYGIDTFVIGLSGTNEYTALLDAMAEAGGRAQVGEATKYYPAENETQLTNALQAIAVSVISCRIELDEAPMYPNFVHIYLDGAEVERDGTKNNGWDYANSQMNVIELYGEPCNRLRDGETHRLTATFACTVG